MRIGLLGELEVHDDDGRGVAIPGAKLRSLLAWRQLESAIDQEPLVTLVGPDGVRKMLFALEDDLDVDQCEPTRRFATRLAELTA